jgi:hypothetical protein|tara:strand:- start:454 stop:567 length:114 start_codon:yes stop_codon:yes gene_type:complete
MVVSEEVREFRREFEVAGEEEKVRRTLWRLEEEDRRF